MVVACSGRVGRIVGGPFALAVALTLAGCGGSSGSTAATASARESVTSSAASGADPVAITNAWVGPATDVTQIPIGDGKSSQTSAQAGGILACRAGNPNGPGAFRDGPWIHGTTWNRTEKVAVEGAVTWPSARFSVTTNGDTRTIVTSGLPVDTVTGTFPIAASSTAYEYDRNPNSIGENPRTVSLPITPTPAASPGCLPFGAIGVLLNGVVLFDAVDAADRDAAAHEVQDSCDGHPGRSSTYHYHDVPSCLQDAATGASTLIGWANDGYPLVLERDPSGALPTNADLDACHGRTSAVLIDGQVVTTYHYSATVEFPYTIGCFHGTNAVSAAGGP